MDAIARRETPHVTENSLKGERLRRQVRTQSAEASADREPHGHQKRRLPNPPSKRFGLGNWHVRSRLIALIVVPTAVAVGLGGLNVVTSLSDANTYQTLREVAELSEQLGAVTHELSFERDETALFIAQGRPKDREGQLGTTHSQVNNLIEDAKQRALALSETHAEAVRPVLRRLEEIPTLRETAVNGKIQPLPMIQKYSQIIARLLQFHDQVGQVAVDDQVADSASAMAAISRAKEQASKQRGILASALDKRGFDSGELDALTDAKSREESEETLFGVLADLDQLELYRNTVVGRDVDQTDLFRLRAMAQSAEGKELSIGVRPDRDVATWFEVSTGKIDALRTVEKELSSSVILRARALEEAANRSALISGVLILILLIVVIAIISLIARSLIRPLRRLRREALDIAGQRLPETVQQLRESGDGTVGPVVPIGVDTHDEIGEVARAFDEVHREAVRLAGEESRLRSNVNAMFVNLSRRSQTLVERQITLIDGLEQGEQDEQRLGNLFKLDHLATRMRRNSENLLVLAGQDPPRRWSQPVKLVDVGQGVAVGGRELRAGRAPGPRRGVGGGAGRQRRHPPARRAGRERAVVLPARDQGDGVRQPDRRRRGDAVDHRLRHRHDAGGAGPGQRAPDGGAQRGRVRLAAHGPVRGRQAGAPARHPRPAPPARLRRADRDGADPGGTCWAPRPELRRDAVVLRQPAPVLLREPAPVLLR
ncbi:hypothetical protein GCM10020220_088880 [Nonomuraea rubra]